MITKIGGRKVMFGLVFLAVGVTLAVVLGDIPPNLLQLLIFLSGFYFAGNVAVHASSALGKKKGKEGDAEALVERMASIENTIEQQAQASLEGIGAIQEALGVILDKTGIAPRQK